MWISRMRVNGGFLAGLDLELSSGLNVVIGPRGVGKTTLLELMRHALGTSHPDAAQIKARQAVIEKLLGPGEVVLDLEDEHGSRHLVVDAAGSGRVPETSSAALMLGQNELERIASSPESRLNLIDLRAAVSAGAPDTHLTARLTAELAETRAQMDLLTDGANRRQVLLNDRGEAATEELNMLRDAPAASSVRRELLRQIEEQILQLTGQLEITESARESLDRATQAQGLVGLEIERVSELEVGVLLASMFDSSLPSVKSGIESIATRMSDLGAGVRAAEKTFSTRRTELRLEAEPIRAELEAVEAGLGQVTARLRNIDGELAQLDRADANLASLRQRYASLKSQRDALLDEYEIWQESVYEARQQIASSVSGDLEQRVIVSVQHLADSTSFRNTLESLMKGGNLQFRPLSDALAKAILPRQLLELAENGDVDGLSVAAGITADRAARVMGQLQSAEAIAVLAEVALEDRVDFRLLDGARGKSVEDLSTGQKCAVTLPIVLTERARLLILDQPEDHLDNAYLVQNVVTALQARGGSGGQTIVATHNANIPVLGSAERVISMASDGSTGFIQLAGRFDERDIVEVITSLMEGGRDAFRRRAEFYQEYGDRGE